MKHIFAILLILICSGMANAQQKNDPYAHLWKEVQKLEKEALTTSALKVVRSISVKAKAEDNAPQIIKALVFTSKYMQILEEDAQLNIINNFKQAIASNTFPTTNILESYLANLYWQYFQQNRYQFYQRTKTAKKVDSTDFRTWDLTTLFYEIQLHFELSLQGSKELQDINVSAFGEIVNQQENSEIYRPTLYDLLANTALEFYKTDEHTITRPADKFEINDTAFLCEAKPYASFKLPSNDKTSLQIKALQLYQDLLNFHLNDKSPEALVDIDLERLRYVYANAVFETKALLFEEVLQNSAAHYKDHSVASLYSYEIALLYNQQANTYEAGKNVIHQWKRKEALGLCEEIIKEHPKSIGAKKCQSLKTTILSKDLQLTVEQNIPINKPSKLLVSYKNHKQLQLTAYQISQHQLRKLRDIYPIEKQLPYIKNLKPVREWNAAIKNEMDYQSHSTEVLLPGLNNGLYLILAMPNGDSKSFAFGHTQVTNMALLESRTSTKHYFQLVDRNHGRPIEHANVKLSYRKNYQQPLLTASFVTDKMGMLNIPLPQDPWTAINIVVSHEKEKARFGEYYLRSKPKLTKLHNSNYTAFLFTDRSIYRPGQPMYYKGIAIKNADGVSSVMKEIKVHVELKDVNGQKVGEQELITNEYGSFEGEFILPNNGLTGNYSLHASAKGINLNGYSDISVEEYKRPKFETSFNPITGTYKVNDRITIKGIARAYAGSTITDAKVVYRVKRVVYYPHWYHWRNPSYKSGPQEIALGETKTDADGNFEIAFKAIPDNKASREGLPVFTYEITADVTDINGETRSASTHARVGYHALRATISAANPLDKESNGSKLKINTTNLNGQAVPAQGTLKMYKLKAPDYVLRNRPWPAPDYKGFTRNKFKELFPYEAFEQENNPAQWEKGALVWEGDFDTQKSDEVLLGNIRNKASGAYVIELETKDNFGQLVKDVAQTFVYSKKDKQLADKQLFDIRTNKATYAIGDEVKLHLASNMKEVYITVLVEKNRKVVVKKVLRLSENNKTITIPVENEDLGGFAINYSFSAHNSFYSGGINIAVPHPSTQLDIETVTFRDKLQPGTEETWSFKIKGPKGDKVASELLASMYDASLDTFKGHYWNFSPLTQPHYYSYSAISAQQSFGIQYFRVYNYNYNTEAYPQQNYDTFDRFGLYFGYGYRNRRGEMLMKNAAPMMELEGQVAGVATEENITFAAESDAENKLDLRFNKPLVDEIKEQNETEEVKESFDGIQIRKNLQETAFFFPQLKTDKEGNVSFSFTTPEALTKWKLQLLAHTKSLESATRTLETVTQKELMVLPNPPRFLREGDEITFSSKIANLTEQALSGEAMLVLTDALSGKDISSELIVSEGSETSTSPKTQRQAFKVDALGNTQISWRLIIAPSIQAVQYKVIARAGNFSDGEQNVLAVLTNRMLVTESLPMWVRSEQTKKFTLKKLRDNTSTTLKHHQLSLEITSNPAWYAVQALPYLMEYPHECNEQMFARYYANTLASYIANSNPKIQLLFKQWANTDALLSNLEKNEELKVLLIQETPWVRDAQSETEQKKRIALLFNLNKMRQEQGRALHKLKNNQMSSGAWAWFKGGSANRYITQHILSGLGHLDNLGATRSAASMPDAQTDNMIAKAISYLDKEFIREYEQMKKYSKDLKKDHLSTTQIHYLYMRSFYKDIPISKNGKEIESYYVGQARKYWTSKNLYAKGLLALSMHRRDENVVAGKILRSLRENSITSDELGMYWKQNTSSWSWYQAPVETQALMIEVFSEIDNTPEEVDNLKVWLLKNKQTNQWKTTKATTEAVYALLLQGSNWMSVDDAVSVLIGGKKIAASKLEKVRVEAGTGYYKTTWDANEINPEMAELEISKKGKGIAWGALYWQYFEDLDKITPAETPLKLRKELFLKKNTATGEEMEKIVENTTLVIGDLIRVRIELRADRAMEFVHMKDMRASGLEPINVISKFKWQDGLGYYESTKDASTNFFFDYLPKGVFVFEYDLRVNNAGDFSNGISIIQSMYAPEFSSHSEGVRVNIGSGH